MVMKIEKKIIDDYMELLWNYILSNLYNGQSAAKLVLYQKFKTRTFTDYLKRE